MNYFVSTLIISLPNQWINPQRLHVNVVTSSLSHSTSKNVKPLVLILLFLAQTYYICNVRM